MVYVDLYDQKEPTPLSLSGATVLGWVSQETDSHTEMCTRGESEERLWGQHPQDRAESAWVEREFWWFHGLVWSWNGPAELFFLKIRECGLSSPASIRWLLKGRRGNLGWRGSLQHQLPKIPVAGGMRVSVLKGQGQCITAPTTVVVLAQGLHSPWHTVGNW